MNTSNTLQTVIFKTAATQFALKIETVQYIVQASLISVLPDAPRPIVGVLNYHGTMTPVIDIGSKFGNTPKPVSVSQYFILCTTPAGLAAIIADEIIGYEIIQMKEQPAHGAGIAESKFIGGVAYHEEKYVFILELEKLFATEDRALINEILSRYQGLEIAGG